MNNQKPHNNDPFKKPEAPMIGVLGLALMAGISTAPAYAEGEDKITKKNKSIEEIIVRGQKTDKSLTTLPGALEDIPQIITVIDKDMLRNQGVNTLEGALRNVPGITTDLGEGGVLNGDQFFIRGLSAKNDIFTDGLRDFGVFVRDSFNYEQVQVLKGSSSTTLGRGVTGGGINTVTKSPTSEDEIYVTAEIGTGKHFRATADWNQSLSDSVAVRLNLMLHKNGVVRRDVIETKRWGISPSIKFGVDSETSVTLTYFHQQDKRIPDYGVGFYQNRPITEFNVPWSNFYGYDTDIDDSNVDTFTVRMRHRLNDFITLTSDSKVGSYDRLFAQTINYCRTGGDCVGIESSSTAAAAQILTRSSPYEQQTWGVQNVSTMLLTAPLGEMKNDLLLGVDFSYQSNERQRIGFDDPSRGRGPKNVLNPVHGSGPALGKTYRLESTTAQDMSFFFHDQLWFTNEFSAVIGGRFNSFDVKQNRTDFVTPYVLGFRTPPCGGAASGSCLTRYKSKTTFFNPKASLIWEPGEDMHYYISYSTSSTPPGVTVSNGTALSSRNENLEPEENKSYEIGAKIGFFDNGLLLQASVFKTEKDNAKDTDPITGDIIASGYKQNVTGFEIGVNGKISEAFTLMVNYTYLDSIIDEAVRRGKVLGDIAGNRTPYTPAHAATIYMTYDFKEAGAPGLKIGGGARYQGDVVLNRDNSQKLPSYVTLNAFASYETEGFRFAINAKNLTNKEYYSQIHSSRVTPAAGRTFIATIAAKF